MKIAIVFLAALSVTACSSIRSFESKNLSDMDEGLSYYMPKRDLKVTITVGNGRVGRITGINFSTTEAYPDLSKRYVLKHSSSLISKNDLDVQITERGLLTSSKSTTTSKLNEVFQSLSESVAAKKTKSNPNANYNHRCTKVGTYTFIYEIPNETGSINDAPSPCGIKINIEKLTSGTSLVTNRDNDLEDGKSASPEKSYSGIFYRQNEPYKVSTEGNIFKVSKIVFSPSNSKISMLPVTKTLFSTNVADFSFEDGVPKKYKQEADAELIALLKLPADVLKSYFTAVGTTFDIFSKQDENEVEMLNASLALELVKYKHTACIEAIKSKDDDLINELQCKPK